MAVLVLITGDSGTGKSSSMRSFRGDEASCFGVARKPLPFKNENKIPFIVISSYEDLKAKLKIAKNKSLIIDDAQYLMAFEFFGSIEEKGYEKFTRMGKNFYSLIKLAGNLADDKIVYFIMHTEHTVDGYEKAKTLGHLLDEKLTLEGLFTISLKTVLQNETGGENVYLFSTQNSGFDRVKTPIGMFESRYIPNDLKLVDSKIREYYQI